MKAEIQRLEAALAEIEVTRARLGEIEGFVSAALVGLRVRAQLDADTKRAAEVIQKRQERYQNLALGLFGALTESAKVYLRDHSPVGDGDVPDEQPKQADHKERPTP